MNKETFSSKNADLRGICVLLAVLAIFSLFAGCIPPEPPTEYPVCILPPPPTETTTTATISCAAPDCEVGDIVTFGEYRTDSDFSASPLKWRVLDIDRSEGVALLITEQVIDARSFDRSHSNVDWKHSDLRKWLNVDFYQIAFSDNDREFIMRSDICTTDYSGKQYYTEDYVFCLSEAEAYEYFDSDNSRQAAPTPYAISQGVTEGTTTGNCCWWLRSAGDDLKADCVDFWGKLMVGGTDVNYNDKGVRPAIYVYI